MGRGWRDVRVWRLREEWGGDEIGKSVGGKVEGRVGKGWKETVNWGSYSLYKCTRKLADRFRMILLSPNPKKILTLTNLKTSAIFREPSNNNSQEKIKGSIMNVKNNLLNIKNKCLRILDVPGTM